ncbi:hypothetical protein BX616_010626 [Lobosporangium transversale]|nr:hypothetical protein BX616_010626 [Lobosporangium transversale]
MEEERRRKKDKPSLKNVINEFEPTPINFFVGLCDTFDDNDDDLLSIEAMQTNALTLNVHPRTSMPNAQCPSTSTTTPPPPTITTMAKHYRAKYYQNFSDDAHESLSLTEYSSYRLPPQYDRG